LPDWLRFAPVDFEAGGSWRDELAAAGFDQNRPAIVVSTGVSMHLTHQANNVTLREVAALAAGTGLEQAARGARASGTPFIIFFMPQVMMALAHEPGFREARHVSAAKLTQRYFAGRTDGLRPPNNAEELLVATTGR
jgi:O-methyltransferase involved in polyketide biosynthesis